MPDVLNNKEGPQQRSPLSASTGGAMEKDWSKKLFDHQLQEAWKKTDRAITPAVEAVCIPAQLAPLSQAAAPPSCSTLTGAEVPQAKKKKKKPCIYGYRVALVVSNFAPLWTVACQASQEDSPGKNSGAYWPILLAIPF